MQLKKIKMKKKLPSYLLNFVTTFHQTFLKLSTEKLLKRNPESLLIEFRNLFFVTIFVENNVFSTTTWA